MADPQASRSDERPTAAPQTPAEGVEKKTVEKVDLDELVRRIERTQLRLAVDVKELRHETQPSVVVAKARSSLSDRFNAAIRDENGGIKPVVMGVTAVVVVAVVTRIGFKLARRGRND